MVDEVDVVVEVPADRVLVGDHEVVSRVHPPGQLDAQLMDALDVLGVLHVELIGGEVLRVAVQLVGATVGPGQ